MPVRVRPRAPRIKYLALNTEARKRTLADLIDRYLKDVLPTARCRKNATKQTSLLNWWRHVAKSIAENPSEPNALNFIPRDGGTREAIVGLTLATIIYVDKLISSLLAKNSLHAISWQRAACEHLGEATVLAHRVVHDVRALFAEHPER